MKKIISLVLCLVFIFTFAVPVFADEPDAEFSGAAPEMIGILTQKMASSILLKENWYRRACLHKVMITVVA